MSREEQQEEEEEDIEEAVCKCVCGWWLVGGKQGQNMGGIKSPEMSRIGY